MMAPRGPADYRRAFTWWHQAGERIIESMVIEGAPAATVENIRDSLHGLLHDMTLNITAFLDLHPGMEVVLSDFIAGSGPMLAGAKLATEHKSFCDGCVETAAMNDRSIIASAFSGALKEFAEKSVRYDA